MNHNIKQENGKNRGLLISILGDIKFLVIRFWFAWVWLFLL